MPDKSCVFNCQSNYHNRTKETFFPQTRKTIMTLDSVGLDLWTEKAGNRQKIMHMSKAFSNRIITKQGLKENDID